mmetsp:Transcript_18537/g.26066  ORF Transcript_18537/g.26066 Transcript_18537/m.26066 type:complete len:196 (+) Transcript_18537:119-706(+)
MFALSHKNALPFAVGLLSCASMLLTVVIFAPQNQNGLASPSSIQGVRPSAASLRTRARAPMQLPKNDNCIRNFESPVPLKRREILLNTVGLFALQSAFPAFSVDSQTAQKMRLARKARMKEKYGSGDLSDDEKRLLTELNNSEAKEEQQKDAAEAGSEVGLNKDVASLKTNKEKQRESIRARLLEKGGATVTAGE